MKRSFDKKELKEHEELLMKYNWLWFAQGYINASIIILERILVDDRIPVSETKELWLPSNRLGEVIIPVFYNIRHIFELIIKTTEKFKDKPVTSSHDKKLLIQSLIDSYGNEDNISKRFIEIMEKYYSKSFYKDNFKNTNLPEDPKNEIFRFPVKNKENKNYVDPSIFTRVNKRLVLEIKEDVEELGKILLRFYSKYQEPKYAKAV